jgi:hypothetical protein
MRRAWPACIAVIALLSCSNGQQQEHAKPASEAAATPPAAEPLKTAAPPGEPAAPAQASAKPDGTTAIPDACRYDGLDKELSSARALWQGTGINSYSMTIQRVISPAGGMAEFEAVETGRKGWPCDGKPAARGRGLAAVRHG